MNQANFYDYSTTDLFLLSKLPAFIILRSACSLINLASLGLPPISTYSDCKTLFSIIVFWCYLEYRLLYVLAIFTLWVLISFTTILSYLFISSLIYCLISYGKPHFSNLSIVSHNWLIPKIDLLARSLSKWLLKY